MVTSRTRLERVNWPSLGAVERWASVFARDIVSALPAGVRRHLLPPTRRIVLELSGRGALEARLLDGRRIGMDDEADVPALRGAAKKHRVALAVPGDQVLSTVLRVPRRAVVQLDRLVTMHIPIWTPFQADDLHFKARILDGSDPRSGGDRRTTCAIELRCVPKSMIEAWVSVLDARSIELDDIWLGPDGTFAVTLDSAKTRRSRRERLAASALAGLASIQVVALVALLCLRLSDRIDATEARLDSIRQNIHASAARSERDRSLMKGVTEIEARATGPESMGHRMALLAKVLPAGATYRELGASAETGGSLVIVSPTRIDPAAMVAATGIMSVTEVNEMDGSQEGSHVYAVAFRFTRADAMAP